MGGLQWGVGSLCVLMSLEPSTTSGGPLPRAEDRQGGDMYAELPSSQQWLEVGRAGGARTCLGPRES